MTRVQTQEREKIAAVVSRYLEPYQPPDFRLNVRPDEIMQDDDWYYVLVEPSREDARSYEYYGRLAEAELDLQEREKMKVLLVPVIPG